jgi:hypothetical protein
MHHRQNKGALWGPYTPSTPPQNTSACSEGCCPSIQSVGVERKASCGVLGGHFCWRRPWLWRLWRVLCFVLRLLKYCKMQKNTKISCLWAIILSITIYCKTYCNSRIANCSVAWAGAVAWPEPEPLWSIEPRHIGSRWKAFVIVRTILTLYWGQKIGILEKERKGYPHHTKNC